MRHGCLARPGRCVPQSVSVIAGPQTFAACEASGLCWGAPTGIRSAERVADPFTCIVPVGLNRYPTHGLVTK